jgi:hypothetical protein
MDAEPLTRRGIWCAHLADRLRGGAVQQREERGAREQQNDREREQAWPVGIAQRPVHERVRVVLSGRARRAPGSAERARQSVTKAINAAIKRPRSSGSRLRACHARGQHPTQLLGCCGDSSSRHFPRRAHGRLLGPTIPASMTLRGTKSTPATWS